MLMGAFSACMDSGTDANNKVTADADQTADATEENTQGEESSAAKPEGDTVVIGVALKTLASEYWQYVKNGLEAGAKEAGAEIIIVGPPTESDVTGQVALIEDLVSQGVDAICVAPNQPDSVGSVLQTAKDRDWCWQSPFGPI